MKYHVVRLLDEIGSGWLRLCQVSLNEVWSGEFVSEDLTRPGEVGSR